MWLKINKLKLNEDKTEFLLIAPPSQIKKILETKPQLVVGGACIQPSVSVRNLGAMFDNTMSMVPQVGSVTRGIYHQLHRIKSIRCHLDETTCAKILNALVTSRLDFNNGLLIALPPKTVARLQVAQNSAARLLTGATKREHITPYLEKLHWLPVHQRIKHKSLTLVHKAINSDDCPQYLKDLISLYSQSRPLRSNNDRCRLQVNRTNIAYGQRSLSSTGSTWWNDLPITLRTSRISSFKRNLKTHLFREHFY